MALGANDGSCKGCQTEGSVGNALQGQVMDGAAWAPPAWAPPAWDFPLVSQVFGQCLETRIDVWIQELHGGMLRLPLPEFDPSATVGCGLGSGCALPLMHHAAQGTAKPQPAPHLAQHGAVVCALHRQQPAAAAARAVRRQWRPDQASFTHGGQVFTARRAGANTCSSSPQWMGVHQQRPRPAGGVPTGLHAPSMPGVAACR